MDSSHAHVWCEGCTDDTCPFGPCCAPTETLVTRIRQLEEENKELLRALEDATAKTVDRDNWRMRGW